MTFYSDIQRADEEIDGNKATERREYHDIARPGQKKVANYQAGCLVRALCTTHTCSQDEPSGAYGGRSIIGMNNMPVFLTPKEYRRCYPFNAVRRC